jgi:hypothetical protein
MDTFYLGTDGTGGSGQTSEHYTIQVLAGDVDSVRARLVAALGRLGYLILEEDHPLHARRPARGWGQWFASADVLDYPTALTIRLKAEGPLKTRATFYYVVQHPYLTKGDRGVLVREAEALAALAQQRGVGAICVACGTEATEDTRFCRRCGTPMAAGAPELEVLRLSADVRAGQTTMRAMFGTLTVLCIAAVVAIAYAAGFWSELPKAARLLAIFGTAGLWVCWIMSLFVMQRICSALTAKRGQRQELTLEAGAAGLAARTAALAPPAEVMSVVEGTTELLEESRPDRPMVYRKGGNTA